MKHNRNRHFNYTSKWELLLSRPAVRTKKVCSHLHIRPTFTTGSRQIREEKLANIGKQVKPKITVQKWTVRGQVRWAVHRNESGKRTRTFFASKKAADAEAVLLRGQQTTSGDVWLTLPAPERQRLIQVYDEAQQLGVNLGDLLADWKRSPRFTGTSPALETVKAELLAAKTAAGRSRRYLSTFSIPINQFAKGRERISMAAITLRDVERFLESKGIRYRQTIRARLSTLFRFAVRRAYRADNPCDRLESVKIHKDPPAILTVEQTRRCLEWLDMKRSRAFAWFVLTTFAGLRPEEAERTSWKEINFTEGWIRVEAQTTKVRQRRVVYPHSTAMLWLNRAKDRKAELPIARQPRRRAIRGLRSLLGFKKWPKDVTRHSAASYWLAETGTAAQIASALGHSESVLRKNYTALVTKTEAKEFWELKPNATTDS
jgi:integrase